MIFIFYYVLNGKYVKKLIKNDNFSNQSMYLYFFSDPSFNLEYFDSITVVVDSGNYKNRLKISLDLIYSILLKSLR